MVVSAPATVGLSSPSSVLSGSSSTIPHRAWCERLGRPGEHGRSYPDTRGSRSLSVALGVQTIAPSLLGAQAALSLPLLLGSHSMERSQ
jgi:hypothetical protein